MNIEKYWLLLTEEQKQQIRRTLNHADELGLDITIVDAVDVWSLLPKTSRGPKPQEVTL